MRKVGQSGVIHLKRVADRGHVARSDLVSGVDRRPPKRPRARGRHRCCAGLDVHKRTVVATVRRVDPAGEVEVKTKTFATMTRDLLALGDWLAARGVTIAAMESTGSYWKPVFNTPEGRVEVVLVNAYHVKQLPGRKTDFKDSQWIAELLQQACCAPASSRRDRPASSAT